MMNDYVKSVLMRYYGKHDTLTFFKAYFTNNTFRFQYALRKCQSSGLSGLYGKVLWKLNRSRKTIQIHESTKIGYGLYIGHGSLVVVNKTAILGNNINLSPFTSIGSNYNQAAVIGHNVYIGPNVCIVENVRIGNNVTIGAGNVVTKDIPDNATAVGNYAKVLYYNDPGCFVHRRWDLTSK